MTTSSRTLEPDLPYRRDEPGPHHRRLADPGRADDGHEPALGEHAQQLIHDRVAPAEVLGLGLAERAEPLVRILGGRDGLQALRLRPEDLSDRGDERVHRFVTLLGVICGGPLDPASRPLGTRAGGLTDGSEPSIGGRRLVTSSKVRSPR